MNYISIVLQIIVALGLLNVWLIRFKQKTPYRGQNAANMAEEFAVYGLPSALLYVVGGLKITIALMLLAGIWYPTLVIPSAALLTILMLGAIAMHIKIADPMKKSIPAVVMLAMSLSMLILTLNVR